MTRYVHVVWTRLRLYGRVGTFEVPLAAHGALPLFIMQVLACMDLPQVAGLCTREGLGE